IFNMTPLSEVVRILNRKYNYTFRYNNDQLDSICFTTTFKGNTIDEIITELKEISTLSFNVDHSKRIIEIK
ncbi:MAG: FecR domain-containing protein, partial [Bacteroidales bacterium]